MGNSNFSIEPFLGAWELDPAQCEYEMGAPPARGMYQLLRENPSADEITVAMDWTDAAGKDFHMVYVLTADGQDHAYADSPAVDAIQTTLLDARTLETLSKKDGVILARGLRELSDDGKAMRVIQTGKTPDGAEFANVAIYLKRS
jgi:hypothetical protein